MTCIKDELIQKYIDRECSVKEEAIVKNHLQSCNKCVEKIEQKRHEANRIKQLITLLNAEDIKIPNFTKPAHKNKRISMPVKRLIYTASAACIIALFFVLRQQSNNDITLVYSYDVDGEYNANLPLSEQDMVIEIIDSEGKLIKF